MKNLIKQLLRENLETPDAKSLVQDMNMFASLGNPYGFRESKIIGSHTDILNKTRPYDETGFSYAITPVGDKQKLSIHFPHIEQSSSRGGGHAGMSFLFGNDVVINRQLVNQLLPAVSSFRDTNFTKLDNGTYQINTNNPSDIKFNGI